MSYVSLARAMELGDVLGTDTGTVERVESGYLITAYGHKMMRTDPIIAARFLDPHGNDGDEETE